MADNRPNVYEEDGKIIYRASSIGMCVKALVAIGRDNYEEAIGKERADLLDRSAREGDLHEEGMRQKLVKEGWEIESSQDTVEIEVIKKVVIRGHTDGILTNADERVLLEVKSMSNKVFDRWVKTGFEGQPKYAHQISCYMKGNPGLDVLYIAKRREDGFEHRQIIPSDDPPIPWKSIRKKVLTAEGHRRRRSSFPACDVSKQDQWWCPLWYLHDEEIPTDEAQQITDEDKAIIADLLPKRFELKEIEEDGKAAEQERKQLDKEILNLMGATDQTTIEVDDYDFQITRVKSGGTKMDLTKLRADYGEELLPYESSYRYQYPKIIEKKKQPKLGKEGTTK